MSSETTPDDVLAALRQELEESGAPVAGASEIAERLPIGRRTVLNRLDVLEARGDVDSRRVGRGRAFWTLPLTVPLSVPLAEPEREPTADDEPPAEPEPEPTAEPPESPGPTTSEPPAEPTPEPTTEDVAAVVDHVAREWARNVEERAAAAVAALEWLRDDGGAAKRQLFVERLRPQHPVETQNHRTWWSETVKPALDAAADRGLVEKPTMHSYRWAQSE